MGLFDFLGLALRVAWGTFTYLLAYRAAPIFAFVSSVLLIAVVPAGRSLGWIRGERLVKRIAGAAALGFTRPTARAEIERNLRSLAGRSPETVVYLAVSHDLTVYYLLLLGPLLGKDVLLSHVIGAVLFVLAGGVLVWVLVPAAAESNEPRAGREPFGRIVLRELGRVAALMTWGLLLGGAVAAWGLGSSAFAPAELVANRWLSQVANAVLALGLSLALGTWPIANLFVGTYLWKVGLAHAGLVAFFYAAVVSPQRIALYTRVLGASRAARLALALALASLVAGLGTAILFRLCALTIHYKLIAEQLL